MCTLHVNKPTVKPRVSHSLFLDIQAVTLLLVDTLFCLHVQISTTPLPGYVHIFQQYLQHTFTCLYMYDGM